MLEKEMAQRLTKFQGLSAEEESKLLSLSSDQKVIVANNDRKIKNEFLAFAPQIAHGTVKTHEKYE